MILVLLFVTATFRPASPTVGEPITIDFTQPVVLDSSPACEIVSKSGKRVVVRTFQPRPFALSGTLGDVRFRNMVVPVRSVLKPKDSLEPAPLAPPRPVPSSRLPLIAIGAATAAAAIIWMLLFRLVRHAGVAKRREPEVPADEHFRRTVEAIRRGGYAQRWAALADATRAFLAWEWPELSFDLTTAELLDALGQIGAISPESRHDVLLILRQGDLEKFSPWGAPEGDFDEAALKALALIPAPVPAEAAA